MKNRILGLMVLGIVLTGASAQAMARKPNGQKGDAPKGIWKYESVEVDGPLALVLKPYFETVDGKKYGLGESPTETSLSPCEFYDFPTLKGQDVQDVGGQRGTGETLARLTHVGVSQPERLEVSPIRVDAMICALDLSSYTPSKHYSSRTENADGTTTFVEPFVHFAGEDLGLTDQSGNCALYGKSVQVGYSMTSAPAPEGKSYKHLLYYFFGNGFPQIAVWNSSGQYRVGSLTCR